MTNPLLKPYLEIERKINPITELLTAKVDSPPYSGRVKGIFTMLGPIIKEPEILFLGYNNGAGAYNENRNRNPRAKDFPVKTVLDDPGVIESLYWFQEGNARGHFDGKRHWHAHQWYQRGKRINNPFPARMLDVLYEVARLKYPEEYKSNPYRDNEPPFWYESLGQRVMHTNLYPIATTNISDLTKIHNALTKELSLKELLGTNKKLDNWEVRKFFIQLTDEMVALVKPKVIVCMGLGTFNDFTYQGKKKADKIYLGEKKGCKVIGFSRAGNWSALIPRVAQEIVKAA